jgi:hypothetical protein
MTWKDLARSGACARANTTAQASLPDQIGVSLTGFGFPSILLVALLFLGAAGDVVKADQITNTYGTGTPVMSWAYYNLLNVGKIGTYWTYYPFQADYSNAVFQGYVSTPADGIWGPVYDFADQDGIFVFRTNVLSSVDQTISLNFGGDDNATAYVNGVFQDYSHIFTKGGHLDLSLTAGIPVSLEIAIYNGPDGWVLGLTRADGQNLLGNDSTITINTVPEPASIFLIAVALAGLAAGAYKKRGLTRSDGRR